MDETNVISKEYNERLDKIQRDIDWIIQYLIKRDAPIQPPPYIQDYRKTYCAKCGMSFESITGYYCSQLDCPIFTKTTL